MNGETSGVEFYFWDGCGLKNTFTRHCKQNSITVLWEYFYENGNQTWKVWFKGKNKRRLENFYENWRAQRNPVGLWTTNENGFWRTYFEDIAWLKVRSITKTTVGLRNTFITEKIGWRLKLVQQIGHWRYFTEGGTLDNEGIYENSKKGGGEVEILISLGQGFVCGILHQRWPSKWTYYFEDSKISSSGVILGSKQKWYWNSVKARTVRCSEVNYVAGTGGVSWILW